MPVIIEKLKCGQCGEAKHEVFKKVSGEILIACTVCDSVSVVDVTPPKLTISNYQGLGTIC